MMVRGGFRDGFSSGFIGSSSTTPMKNMKTPQISLDSPAPLGALFPPGSSIAGDVDQCRPAIIGSMKLPGALEMGFPTAVKAHPLAAPSRAWDII